VFVPVSACQHASASVVQLRLAADTSYGTGKFLGWLVKDKKIAPHIPVWENSDRQDGTFSRSDFRWDKRQGVPLSTLRQHLRGGSTLADGDA